MKELPQKRLVAFIGSYAEASEPGLYIGHLDQETGELIVQDQESGLKNPTFLDLDEENLRLYAIAEGKNAAGNRCGEAAAFQINLDENGSLSLINIEQTVDASTCHISLDQTRRNLFVSSYHGGMVGLIPIEPDGRIGTNSDIHQHTGSGLLPVQSQPRAHSMFTDRNNRYALVCDLGLDRVIIYKLNSQDHKLDWHSEIALKPGSGPRHFAFHPDRPYGYVINELNYTVTAFSYNEELGQLEEIQTITTLPESYKGDNACADIHISPDGRFLYGSNRGHDSIVVYAIDPSTGNLSLVEHVSTMGKHPRNFAITPDGKFLLAANMDTNNIVTFSRDTETGKLQPTGNELELSRPVCIKFLTF
jgi:6-phosphogluconolactonase